jgi:hypothetical protein
MKDILGVVNGGKFMVSSKELSLRFLFFFFFASLLSSMLRGFFFFFLIFIFPPRFPLLIRNVEKSCFDGFVVIYERATYGPCCLCNAGMLYHEY